MKKIVVSLIAAVSVLFGTGIPAAGAWWVILDFTEYTEEFTVDAPPKEGEDYYLAKKLTVTKDFALPKNTDLYIGFMYSYQTRSLEAHAYGFQAGYAPGDEEEEDLIFMDDVLEEKVGRV